MTEGLVDSASIHSAIAALVLRDPRKCDPWTNQVILDATYLLLHSNIGVVPGPGDYEGASGHFARIITQLPSLGRRRLDTEFACQATQQWLSRWPKVVEDAWTAVQSNPTLEEWGVISRRLFWLNHVQMHRYLFDADYLPTIAQLTGASLADLRRLHRISNDQSVVRRWQREKDINDDFRLAEKAYRISALIRGKFHEFVARNSGVQLLPHPLRQYIPKKLAPSVEVPVTNSEQIFVKMLVGAALRETTQRSRVDAWVTYIRDARRALNGRSLYLPETETIDEAERRAADAVRAIGACTTPRLLRAVIDLALSTGGGLAVSLVIAPWLGPIVTVANWAFRFRTGAGLGDRLSRSATDTTRRFAKLAATLPGRIKRPVEHQRMLNQERK